MKSYRLILKAFAGLTFLAFAIGATSCHTMHGVGQDIGHAGHAIEDAAH